MLLIFEIVTIGDLVLQATQSLGLRIHLGIWVSADVNTFQAEQAKLIELAHAYSFNNVDGVIVGSETQYRGDVSPETLADMISQVKQSLAAAGVNVPVATADVYYKLDPVIVAQVDFVMM
jgi:glucan 1,3-beta-glucosidase